jgi:hypothetical protein
VAHRDLVLIHPEGDKLPPASPFHNEGRTPAGWLVCYGLMLGSAILGAGMIAAIMPLVYAGGIVIALVLIAGVALRAAGLGQPAPEPADHAKADQAKGEHARAEHPRAGASKGRNGGADLTGASR